MSDEAMKVEVRADFAQFEKAILKLQNQTDAGLARVEKRFSKSNDNMRKESRGMSGVFADVQKSASGALGGLPTLGSGMGSLGLAGAAAAVGVGALVASLRGVKDAAKFAADLTDAADRIGVGVESLQELRYAADETGVPLSALDSSLETLNGTLGAFVTGIGAGKIKPVFKALGIEQADLANVHNANDLLPILADTLGQVQNRAEQVQLARKLGVEPLLPIIRLGSVRLKEMAQSGRDLGLVMAGDVVAGLDETDRALEKNQQQIEANVRSMQANLAPFFLWASDGFAKLTRGVGDFISSLNRAENRNARVLGDQAESLQRKVTFAYQQAPRQAGGRLTSVQEGWVRELKAVTDEIAARARASIASSQSAPSAADRAVSDFQPDYSGSSSSSGGGQSGARTSPGPDRDAQQALARDRRFEDGLEDVQRDRLQAQVDLATTSQQRASIAILLLDHERQERRVDLERQVIDGDLTAARRDALLAAEETVWSAREANIAARLDNEELEIARDQMIKALQADAQAQEAARQTYDLAKEGFRHDFVDGMRAALDGELGGFFESLADRFTDKLLGNLADQAFSALFGTGKGSKGVAGGWAAGIGNLFGFARAGASTAQVQAPATVFWLGCPRVNTSSMRPPRAVFCPCWKTSIAAGFQGSRLVGL